MDRKLLIDVKDLYRKGENITKYIRSLNDTDQNSIEAIDIAYDLQTGTYIGALKNPDFLAFMNRYSAEFAEKISDLDIGEQVLDIGTGEGTTFSRIAKASAWEKKHLFAFDISWSRAHFAAGFLRSQAISATIFTAEIAQIPLPSNSIDTVISSHALEPNGGRERELLSELYRVSSRYLVLLEPSNELGSDETKARMLEFGYVQNLRAHAEALGMNVVLHELMENTSNPKNQTAILVVEKPSTPSAGKPGFTSPGSDSPLVYVDDDGEKFHHCPEEGLVFPHVRGIPCLRRKNAILASKLDEHPDV